MNPDDMEETEIEIENEEEVNTCPTCGMLQEQWSNQGHGVMKDDTAYCCEGCADGTGCICEPDERPAAPVSQEQPSGLSGIPDFQGKKQSSRRAKRK